MNIKVISVSLVVLVAALMTTVLPAQAQTANTPTGLTVTQELDEPVMVEWDEVPGTTYYLIKWISVSYEGQPGIEQMRDGNSVTTSPIEENITPGATIQSASTRGTSVELPADLADGVWFLFVAAATSAMVSDYSEPVYFSVMSYDDTPDVPMATRWWNALNGEQMVAALFGDEATEEQMTAAKKMYADLDGKTKALVNAAAAEIYGEGGHYSVGQWWETLDCRLMRIAAGDGNMADPESPYCAHYPGSGAAKILDDESKMFVDMVGKALLGRYDIGVYPMDSAMAMRWWNALNGEQMVAALFGDEATEEQMTAAKKMYADLDSATKGLVNAAAAEIYGEGGHYSVGQWWETLDCRLMRIAAGDGNTADPESPYCAHYPGSGAAKILDDDSKMFVDMVGKVLLGRYDIGVYPMDSAMAMRWWNALNGEQMVAALFGDEATEEQMTAAKKMYADLDSATKGLVNAAAAEIYGEGGHYSVGQWWETLDCRLMRIAAGDGNTADPESPYCAHYPGSGAAKILDDDSKMFVDMVGKALLGRYDIGVYPMDSAMAMRWWNVLNGEQMVAALFGDEATEEQMTAAKKMYADLDGTTKGLVNYAAAKIYGEGGHYSVGQWWETLDCRLMRIAAGDGNMADPESPYCAHYPGSGAAKILDDESKMFVDMVGKALLGRYDIGVYPMDKDDDSGDEMMDDSNGGMDDNGDSS